MAIGAWQPSSLSYVTLNADVSGNLNVTGGGGGGGGTQYADGTTNTTPTGTVALGKNPSNVLHSLALDASGNLNVNLAAGSISGGNAAASPTGAAVPASADYVGYNSAGNLVGVSTANPLPVAQQGSVAVTGTFWQATQPVSGTFWQATQPVSIATLPALATGSNVIGAVTQSGTWTVAGSGSFTVAGTVTANQGGAPWTMKPDGTAWTLTGTAANVNVTNASIAVTGTFWQATQPVSGTVAVSNFPASQAVTGTFWQATQPVSIATMPTTPVTGTFWQATQPVSIATAVTTTPQATYNNPRLVLTAGQSAGLSLDSDGSLLVSVVDSILPPNAAQETNGNLQLLAQLVEIQKSNTILLRTISLQLAQMSGFNIDMPDILDSITLQ